LRRDVHLISSTKRRASEAERLQMSFSMQHNCGEPAGYSIRREA